MPSYCHKSKLYKNHRSRIIIIVMLQLSLDLPLLIHQLLCVPRLFGIIIIPSLYLL